MWKALVVGSVLMVLVAASGFAPVADSKPACVVALEWVEAHPESIPRTLDELKEFGPVYRRTIWVASPDEVKIRLLEEQLDLFVEQHPELGQRQLDFITHQRDNLALYFGMEEEHLIPLVLALSRRSTALFGSEGARAAFGAPGSYRQLGNEALAQSELPAELCHCSLEDPEEDCAQGYSCQNEPCEVWGDKGCGWLGALACTGLCKLGGPGPN